VGGGVSWPRRDPWRSSDEAAPGGVAVLDDTTATDRRGTVNRLSKALILLVLLPACNNVPTSDLGLGEGESAPATAYCTPNFTVAGLPDTQSGSFNSTGRVCFVVRNAGPLGFNCSNMQGRTVTVNGTTYSAADCTGSVTVPDANGGQYYFDVSAGGLSHASVAFWATGGSGGSPGPTGSCTAVLSAGQKWSDRYNLNVTVTGSDYWRVTMTYPSQETMIATWNINAAWPQANVLVATPSGAGSTWGVTLKPNGNWTWPTVKCETYTEPVRVHTKLMTCAWDGLDEKHLDQCSTDPGFVLTGGGAYARYTGAGAMLTASYPEENSPGYWWWVTSSQDLQQVDAHALTSYAIGLQLNGVNTITLRNRLSKLGATYAPGGASRPAGTLPVPPLTLGGGAFTTTTGAGQFLTQTMPDGASWKVASKDHLVSSPGSITATGLSLQAGIIEWFGALEVRQMKATPTSVATGVGTSVGQVTPGWELVSLGGEATTTSGAGRMLFRIGVDETGRNVIVQSKDHLSPSAGRTTASWIEARKVPGSHGLCNAGTALAPNLDPCVAQVCAADSRCCQTGWDATCVARVTSVCGKSCADYTCSIPSYTPRYWNDGGTIQANNNCYNYATNKRTDNRADPGGGAGHSCHGRSGCDVAGYVQLATNDGLIPTTRDAACPDNRALVALFVSDGDYHWFRRDSNGRWSHKPGDHEATNLDWSGKVITDPETADRGPYHTLGSYFCVCSSAVEGQGHELVDGPH
jgi:hypothetical protein